MQYSIENLSKDVFAAISELAKNHYQILLAMGGGSTTQAMSSFWPLLSSSGFSEKLVVTVTDERIGSFENSNIARIAEMIVAQGIPTTQLIEWLDAAGEVRRSELRAVFAIKPKILLIGIGQDGHVAGILPHKQEYSEEFLKNDIVTYSIDKTLSNAMQILGVEQRASLDLEMLKLQILEADFAAIVWRGNEKRKIFEKIIGNEQMPVNEFPSVILREFIQSGKLKVYCD